MISVLRSQTISENFDSDLWPADYGWLGSVDSFQVRDGALWSNSSYAPGRLRIAKEFSVLHDLEWSIRVYLGFNPSTTNKLRIYFWSDSLDFTHPAARAYYAELGESGNDDTLRFYVKRGLSDQLLWKSKRAIMLSSGENLCDLRVVREGTEQFRVDYKLPMLEVWQSDSGIVMDSLGMNGYMGMFCWFGTGSRGLLYSFDNVYVGPFRRDTTLPVIERIDLVSDKEILIHFNEEVELYRGVARVFPMQYGIQKYEIDSISPNEVHLWLSKPMQRGVMHTLSVDGFIDKSRNQMLDTTVEIYWPGMGDIVINEIHLNPDTLRSKMPPIEYVELRNVSANDIQLCGWKLGDLTTYKNEDMAVLPNYLLRSGSYVIITGIDSHSSFPLQTIYCKDFPTLNNDADVLFLQDSTGFIINVVSYNSSWFDDIFRSGGGFSIERRDDSITCSDEVNWAFSRNVRGGTPGFENSLGSTERERDPVFLEGIISKGDEHVLKFEKSVRFTGDSEIEISPGVTMKVRDSLADQRYWKIVIDGSFGEEFLRIPGVWFKNCDGSRYYEDSITLYFEPVRNRYVKINEILFNPSTGGNDFVEIANTSSYPVLLQNCWLSELDILDTSQQIESCLLPDLILNPNGIQVFTVSGFSLREQYPVSYSSRIYGVDDMPNYPDDEGWVQLRCSDTVLDRVYFNDEMHYKMLSDKEGVSLERISKSLPSDQKENWSSCPSRCLWASPGEENCSHFEIEDSDLKMQVTPRFISPNGDGEADRVWVCVQTKEPMIVKMQVYNLSGMQIRQLASSTYVSGEHCFSWDGMFENGRRTEAGIYWIYMQQMTEGMTESFVEKVIVLPE